MLKFRFSTNTLLIIAGVLQIVWGLVPSASKLVISEIPVELYIAIRWTISGLIFLAVIFFTSNWPRLLRKETVWVAVLGIGGYALASFGTLYGLKIGGVTNFALMGALNPIITSVVAILVLKEKPLRLFYFALPLCVIGLLFLVAGKHRISSWEVAISSSAFIIGAAFLEAVIFVFSKKLKLHFSSVQYLAISQLSAAVFMWGLQTGVFHQLGAIQNLTTNGWIAAIFVSVVACVLCYSILYWLLNHIDGHRLALFDGLHTLSATLFGFLFFQEVINAPMAIGGFLLMAGLVLGNLPDKFKAVILRNRSPLIGKWRLQSYEGYSRAGIKVSMTDGQQGHLEYTSNGKVSVSIRRDPIVLEAIGLNSRLANIQYSGRFETDPSKNLVLHHIEKSNEVTRIGTIVTRCYSVTENHLEIKGTGFDGEVTLHWLR